MSKKQDVIWSRQCLNCFNVRRIIFSDVEKMKDFAIYREFSLNKQFINDLKKNGRVMTLWCIKDKKTPIKLKIMPSNYDRRACPMQDLAAEDGLPVKKKAVAVPKPKPKPKPETKPKERGNIPVDTMKAWRVRIHGVMDEVMYSISRGKVRYMALCNAREAGHRVTFSDVKVTRAPHFDYLAC